MEITQALRNALLRVEEQQDQMERLAAENRKLTLDSQEFERARRRIRELESMLYRGTAHATLTFHQRMTKVVAPTCDPSDPAYWTLYAAEDCELREGQRSLVSTGIYVSTMPGFVILAHNHPHAGLFRDISVSGLSPDYERGHGVFLTQTRERPVQIRVGDPIAQITVVPTPSVAAHFVPMPTQPDPLHDADDTEVMGSCVFP